MKHVTQPNDPANAIYTTTENRFKENVTQLECAGMTKREIISMHLYAAILAGHKQEDLTVTGCENHAYSAIRCADALINELNRTAQ